MPVTGGTAAAPADHYGIGTWFYYFDRNGKLFWVSGARPIGGGGIISVAGTAQR